MEGPNDDSNGLLDTPIIRGNKRKSRSSLRKAKFDHEKGIYSFTVKFIQVVDYNMLFIFRWNASD